MSAIVQKREGRCEQVPMPEVPDVALSLEPGQYVVGFELRGPFRCAQTEVADWTWTAYVVTPETIVLERGAVLDGARIAAATSRAVRDAENRA